MCLILIQAGRKYFTCCYEALEWYLDSWLLLRRQNASLAFQKQDTLNRGPVDLGQAELKKHITKATSYRPVYFSTILPGWVAVVNTCYYLWSKSIISRFIAY